MTNIRIPGGCPMYYSSKILNFLVVKLCCLTLSIGWAELAEIKEDS
jgi:hypothetical protein